MKQSDEIIYSKRPIISICHKAMENCGHWCVGAGKLSICSSFVYDVEQIRTVNSDYVPYYKLPKDALYCRMF